MWNMSGGYICFSRSGIIRSHRFKIDYEHFSMECRQSSFVLRVASTWNSSPDDVVAHETVQSFKSAIRSGLNEKLFHFGLLRYFVWLLLLAFSVFFGYFCRFKFKFHSNKLFISLFVLLLYCFICVSVMYIYIIWIIVLHVSMRQLLMGTQALDGPWTSATTANLLFLGN